MRQITTQQPGVGVRGINYLENLQNGMPAYRYLFLALLLCTSVTAKVVAAEAPDSGMNWYFTPYVWMSDTSISASINDHTIAEGEIEFPDMIDKVEAAFQGHLEGYGEHFGFFVDLTYISAEDGSEHDDISVDAGVDTGILELAAVYNVAGKGLEGLSLFAGARRISIDQKLTLQIGDPSDSEHKSSKDNDWTDLMLGARYGIDLPGKWELGLRGDYSMGDTEGALNLQALIGYRVQFWKISGATMFGYRYMEFDLEDGAFKSELSMSGPMIGMRFEF
jgi:hypothetical protein